MSEIEEIKSRLALILNEPFEIKDYKINNNQDIEIMIRLPEESFDVYVYTNLDRNKYFETSYYCNFHNNKREFDFNIKNIETEAVDMIHRMPNFVEIFSHQLNFWLRFTRQ
jgi:hypothetical protein